MGLSNDNKWNKIKAIEREFWETGTYLESELKEKYPSLHFIRKADIWELANQLYNIATEGLVEEDYTCSYTAISRENTIKIIRKFGKYYRIIDKAWEDYEYTNS